MQPADAAAHTEPPKPRSHRQQRGSGGVCRRLAAHINAGTARDRAVRKDRGDLLLSVEEANMGLEGCCERQAGEALIGEHMGAY